MLEKEKSETAVGQSIQAEVSLSSFGCEYRRCQTVFPALERL